MGFGAVAIIQGFLALNTRALKLLTAGYPAPTLRLSIHILTNKSVMATPIGLGAITLALFKHTFEM